MEFWCWESMCSDGNTWKPQWHAWVLPREACHAGDRQMVGLKMGSVVLKHVHSSYFGSTSESHVGPEPEACVAVYL